MGSTQSVTRTIQPIAVKLSQNVAIVHSKASNDACCEELNRLPLRGKILNLAFNYWQPLWSSSNSLVSKIVDLARSHNSWFIQMGSIFNTLGFSYLSYIPNSNLLNKQSIMQRINDIQLQEQNVRLKNSKKLNILMKLYSAGIRPYYVDILKKKIKMKEPCLVNYVLVLTILQ